jgi:hypothetical protein
MTPKEDILLWSDGFWCFRGEHQNNLMRGANYRVVLEDSEEWIKLTTPLVLAPISDNLL